MLPDLSPHLHTDECNFLIQLMKECHAHHKITRYVGKCNYWDEAVWQCTKQERILRRETNAIKRRNYEIKRLPEERYTPALKRLKEEGKLILDGNDRGCKL